MVPHLSIYPRMIIQLEDLPNLGHLITPLSKEGGSIGGILSDQQIKFVGLILTFFIQWKLPLIMAKVPITNVLILQVKGNTAGISI